MHFFPITRSLVASVIVWGFFPFIAQTQTTVSNLTAYQVISRTSLTSANFDISGTCKSTAAKIQLSLTSQDADSVIKPFAWKDITAIVSGTSWSAQLTGLPVGGEYKARFRSLDAQSNVLDSSSIIQHLLVGDVWLAAGQSNMQKPGGSNPDRKHVHVRSLWFGSGATIGSGVDTSHWNCDTITGPCFSFGGKLFSLTGVPVGIVFSAAGNTSINDWFGSPQRPLFSMTAKLVTTACKFKLNGFLWYQGENEDQQDTWASRYFVKAKPLRDTVRALANNPTLPFIAVQLESWDGLRQYTLAQDRWPRWPIIRDQQELLGASDANSATIPAWDYMGLHIDDTSQAAVGSRMAFAAAKIAFQKNVGYGPRFKSAWFIDSTRTKIVVQFQNVTGNLLFSPDTAHLGFFVMQPKLFTINDSAIFRYGATAKMLRNIKSVTALDKDKATIELETAPAAAESLTVGYGRNINLITLKPLTDSTGIPALTFFNRPIAKTAPVAAQREQYEGKTQVAGNNLSIMPVWGGTDVVIRFNCNESKSICLDIISLEGKRIVTIKNKNILKGSNRISLTRSAGRGFHLTKGVYLCRITAKGYEESALFNVLY
jgi:hypothetical protein